MTPAVRLVTLLVVAFMAGTGDTPLLVLATALTLGAWSLQGLNALGQALYRLRRLRWLLLSIAVIYLWLTPGTPLIGALGSWSPTLEGLTQGLHRVGVLCVIALAAWLLVSTTGREALAGGLIWLLAPLARLGLPADRFAVRLSLTLDLVLGAPPIRGAPAPSGRGGFWARAVALGSERFRAAEEAGRRAHETPVEVPRAAAPPPVQWLIPAAIATLATLLLVWQAR